MNEKTMDERKRELEQVVSQYADFRDEARRANSTYNEPQVRKDLIDRLLNILGWDVDNVSPPLPQHLREVVIEKSVPVLDEDEFALLSKRPDYAVRVAGNRKYFVEAKKPSVRIERTPKPAFQVRRYGWNARLAISVLTNFENLAIYDCTYKPSPSDGPAVARLKLYGYREFVSKFEEIYGQLSREAVFSGKFDKLFAAEREVAGSEPFDRYFLVQIEQWRRMLAEDLVKHNPDLRQEEINLLVQRLINRIVFLRICEDRSLEKYKGLQQVLSYKELKDLFIKADRKYNSGLFDFVEDELSLNVDVGSQVLVGIFKELYYPKSPYAFSVVEPELLGEIYELFLGKMVKLTGSGGLEIADKPEVIESGGVVPTPKFIVDAIVNRTLGRICEGKSPDQLANLRIADIAAGSGTFLVQAFDYLLNHHLEWYLHDGAQKHKERVYEAEGNQWYLTLQEKQRILLNNIFGVDIDPQAVESTRFGLLLMILENESAASVDACLSKFKKKALPNLNDRIQCGNSLVDSTSYLAFDPNGLSSAEQMGGINPLDWNEAFEDVMQEGGFDAIVGNPPYIRIQNMVKYSPNEARFYQSSASPYSCAKSDNFDKYALFIERALGLLRKDGALGYIVPHKFFVIKSGKALRKLLSDGRLVKEIVHFGAKQVFGTRTTTYTCILVLEKRGASAVQIEHVHDLERWKYTGLSDRSEIPSTALTENPWELVPLSVRKLFDRIRKENPTKLKDVAKIFVGVQTSADKIYLIKPLAETASSVTFKDQTGKSWTVEKGILRPSLLDVEFRPFGSPSANTYIIFPYRVIDGKARPYPAEEMATAFPKCLAYLDANKAELAKRNVQNPSKENWYQYGRSQSLTKFDDQPKLVWSTISRGPRYNYDPSNIVITGGGNGPYYALRSKEEGDLIFYLQVLLSHPVLDAMVASHASVFRGGYISHGKQFITDLPVKLLDVSTPISKKVFDEIVETAKQLNKTFDALSKADTPEKKRVGEALAGALVKKAHSLVEKVYGISEEETQAAVDYLRSSFPGDAD